MTIQELYAALTADYEANLLPPSVIPSEKPQRTWERVLVFGEGNRNHAPILLIGEAPGKDETIQRRPFVGKAGKNLDEFLQAVELKREDIWITNVVKVRPMTVSPKGTVSNRPPDKKLLAFFTPYLHREVEELAPRLIVTLGNTALHAMAGDKVNIGETHGRVMETEKGRLFPLYHPASVIYNRALAEVYQDDLVRLKKVLDEENAASV